MTEPDSAVHETPEEAQELIDARSAIVEILRPFYDLAEHCNLQMGDILVFIEQSLIFFSAGIHGDVKFTKNIGGFEHVCGLLLLVEYWYQHLASELQSQIQGYTTTLGCYPCRSHQNDQIVLKIYEVFRPKQGVQP